MVGYRQVISCNVSTVTGVAASLVIIRWEGPGGGSITGDDRITISRTTPSDHNHISNLEFAYLMEGDEGMYTCNVTIFQTNATASASIVLENFSGELS